MGKSDIEASRNTNNRPVALFSALWLMLSVLMFILHLWFAHLLGGHTNDLFMGVLLILLIIFLWLTVWPAIIINFSFCSRMGEGIKILHAVILANALMAVFLTMFVAVALPLYIRKPCALIPVHISDLLNPSFYKQIIDSVSICPDSFAFLMNRVAGYDSCGPQLFMLDIFIFVCPILACHLLLTRFPIRELKLKISFIYLRFVISIAALACFWFYYAYIIVVWNFHDLQIPLKCEFYVLFVVMGGLIMIVYNFIVIYDSIRCKNFNLNFINFMQRHELSLWIISLIWLATILIFDVCYGLINFRDDAGQLNILFLCRLCWLPALLLVLQLVHVKLPQSAVNDNASAADLVAKA